MMKKLIFFCLAALCVSRMNAQLDDGATAPDFTAVDVHGNSWNLYSILDEGKSVVIHVFATWDEMSWSYLQGGEMQLFNATYGPDGTNEVVVLSIEGEASNTLAQLYGPQLISNADSSQTYGDWITGNSVPVIDSAAVATLLQVNYVPTVYIVCPDRIVRNTSQISAEALYNEITGASCPVLTEGFDPALTTPQIQRSCGNTEIEFSFLVKNLGTEVLTNLDYQVLGVNGNPSFNWTGNLASFHSEEVVLTGLQIINDDPISVVISTPNANETNDSIAAVSAVGLSTLRVQLELGLDFYADEINWEIRNSNDSIIFSDGDFSVPYEYFNDYYDLPGSDCYTFYIYDSEGDGLHGSQWGGFDGSCYLRSVDEDNNVTSVLYANDGSTNFSPILNSPAFQSVQFDAGTSLGQQELTSANGLQIYPNPTSGAVQCVVMGKAGDRVVLDLLDAAGRLVQTYSNGASLLGNYRFDMDLTSLENGLYYVRVISGNTVSQQKLILSK